MIITASGIVAASEIQEYALEASIDYLHDEWFDWDGFIEEVYDHFNPQDYEIEKFYEIIDMLVD